MNTDAIRGALSFILASDRDTWVKMGMAVKSELGEDGFDLWDEWSQQDESYNAKDARDVWKSISVNGGVTIGTLYHEAQQAGFRFNGESHSLTPEEIAERMRIASERAAKEEAEKSQRHASARDKAASIWAAAKSASGAHPYLALKGVKAHGLRVHEGALVVPMRDGDELHSLQLIRPDGAKRFLTGGRARGCYFSIGKPDDVICIAEGFATAASIHECTGHAVVVAFSAGNLEPVAKALRAKFPEAKIIVAGDHDLNGTGQRASEDAARAVNGRIAIPKVDVRDWNDVHRIEGPAAVRTCIEAALDPLVVPDFGEEPQPGQEDAPQSHGAIIEGALTKQVTDVGAVFEADVVAALKAARERNPAEYQRYRKRAKDAGASVGELDRLVCASGGDGEEAAVKGRKIVLYQPEPWPETVNGAEVLDEALAKIKRHMSILNEHAVGAVLWAAHTHVYNVCPHTPRLLINAPEAECGKTLLLFHLVGALVPRPQAVELMKPAPFFRLAEEFKPCFLIDEVDVFIKEDSDLLAAINNGWEAQGGVPRCVGEDFEVRIFSTHTPVAMGGVKLHKVLPGTTWSRSIVVTLDKATETEIVEHYDPRKHRAGLLEVGRKLARWCSDNANDLRRAEPTLPGNAYNRRADKWRPLFAIAELAGGEWPDRARRAFLSEEQDGGVNGGVALDLLADIRELLRPHEHVIATKDLIGRLCAIEESRWAEYNYREREPDRRCIRGRQLSGLLKDYRIKPGSVRPPGDATLKGYKREDLERVFLRYLPIPVSVTPSQMSPGAGSSGSLSVTNDQNVTDKKTPKPAPHKDCDGVTDQKEDISQTEAWSTRI